MIKHAGGDALADQENCKVRPYAELINTMQKNEYSYFKKAEHCQ